MILLTVILIICILIFIVIYIVIKNSKHETFYAHELGINRLDAVIFINLDNRKDRKILIEKELENMGVKKEKIIRFPAIYEKYNGHLGCVKSHIEVLKIIKQSNFKNALILEDDFKFTLPKQEINKKIDHFLEKFINNWDAIHLSHSYWNKQKQIDNHICKINSAMTSSGYIVNNHNNFYDKLLNDFQNSEEKLTENLKKWLEKNPNKKKYEDANALNQHWSKLQKKSQWYIFEPPLGIQRNSYSSIMSPK
jgi:glycosyl transferase, family 25